MPDDANNHVLWREWTSKRLEKLERDTEHMGVIEKEIADLRASLTSINRALRAIVSVFMVGTVGFGFWVIERLTDLV